MANGVKFVLNKKEFQRQVLMGAGTEALLNTMAIAAKPSGASIVVEPAISSNAKNQGRARARIIDTSFSAMSREAREGHLSAALGISAGDRKVKYTTKAGKTRLATAAQVANWTRGIR